MRQLWKQMKVERDGIVFLLLTLFFLLLLIVLPEGMPPQAKGTMAITIYGILLWTFEPIAFGITSVIVMLLLLFLKAASIDIVLAGFSSPAIFLIIAGMMMAQGISQTRLMERITYFLLTKWGNSSKGIFISSILFMQLQAFFIPATAVRSSLVLPIILKIINSVKAHRDSNFTKLMLIGTAFGGNISGTAILTAAVGNILTVEMLSIYLGTSLSYFDWFIYALPIWILVTMVVPWTLWKVYKPETYDFSSLQKEIQEKRKELGKLTTSEKKAIAILTLVVGLWVTEPFHGYHPTVAALLACVLMALPKIGFTNWKHIVKVNFDMVLLVGATLSLGLALIESQAIDYMAATLLSAEWIALALASPWLTLIFVTLATQVYHLGVTNVSTVVVTLLPILISLSVQAGYDPVVICYLASITTLYGFILVVETMPNVVVYSTGLVEQRDFLLPGLWATLASMIITILVAFTWWRWLGFWP